MHAAPAVAPGSASSAPAPTGWVIRRPDPEAAASPPLRIWGLSAEERLLRALRRAGCRDARIVDPARPPRSDGPVVALRGDVVLDERVVAGLRDAPDTLLACPELGAIGAHVAGALAAELLAALGGRRPDGPLGAGGRDPDGPLGAGGRDLDGVRRAAPADLVPAYVAKLRKREPPLVLPARPELAAEIERRTFAASYKGATDLVTRWVWPRPARAATRWCAERGVRPNTVTLASWALAIAAAWLFARGQFAAGLACGWAMTFLDTVDGKLARVTLSSSRVGDVLDHGLDLLHPPFWWWAWGVGLGAGHEAATAVAIGGYVALRALEGAFLAFFGFEIHSWRPIDGLFRTITARRNPNLILLTVGAAGGRPDLGLVMLALWTGASIAFHAARLARAARARATGGAVAPWESA